LVRLEAIDPRIPLGSCHDVDTVPSQATLYESLRTIPPSIVDPLDKAFTELNALVGLGNLKRQLGTIRDQLRVERLAGGAGKRDPGDYLFLGNPGTGKTTVARLMGRALKALGLLDRGHVVRANREDLVAGYVGQTAIQVRQRFDEALGGVLFIDEAYSLAKSGPNQGADFGQEAIDTLTGLMEVEPYKTGLAVVAAGYPDDMQRLLHANDGLPSRFPENYHIRFDDFVAEEMMQILEISANGSTFDPAARTHLAERFASWERSPPRRFGNARTINNLWNAIVQAQRGRLARLPDLVESDERLSRVAPSDVEQALLAFGV
jgi:stage V sporulation protein K